MRLIDADALETHTHWECFENPDDDYEYVLKTDIDNAPTIEAEPVKCGQWKPFDLTWGRSIYACTNCGEAFEVPTEGNEPMYDYCPYCGARMMGGVRND